MEDHKVAARRMAILFIVTIGIMLSYFLKLIYLQLINSEEYLKKATSTTSYKFTITAARGDIVDCYGRRIATNTTCYNVVLNKLMMGDADLNGTLQELVGILQSDSEAWNDSILISSPNISGSYEFTDNADSESDQTALSDLKKKLDLQQYASADDVMNAIVERYELESYSRTWQRILGGIRYQMEREEFSNVNNFTLAENVSEKTVATIKERSLTLSGAEIVETSTRSYPDGTILPHVLGRVGKITAERWKVTDEAGNVTFPLKEKGYAMNDVIGISGLELAYEDQLRGTDGEETITRDSDGAIISKEVTTEPKPGLTVMQTINSEFEKSVADALEQTILTLQQGETGKGGEANAGAVVVLDVKTGAILASPTYPSYDQNLYSTNYSAYSTDPGTPLYNRALQGLYTPGSTFKPAVAIAAQLSGTMTPSDTVTCTHTYTYFSDYQPKCVNHYHGVGTRVDLVNAIKWSCNIYFYDVGRRTTSDVYDDYAYRLGLGVRTGVEVPESTGRLTTKSDANYTNSLEIQAAIGQGNTVVTPVQMATYAATIANKGVRYKTHYVKALLDTNTGEVVEEIEPEIAEVIDDPIHAFDYVEQGMVGVTSTVATIANYPYTIACKTGTPQRSETYISGGTVKHYDNTMMIAYGPVEDPQIAIGIVIEYGSSGAKAGSLVADIFNAYFFEQSNTLEQTPAGTLLE